jgi:23S rRNA pseudouridine1911/1915/1917 synthase
VTQLDVPRERRGDRLDRFLARAVPGLSPDRARGLCEAGRVRIGGKPAKADRKLWGGESVDLDLPPPTPAPKVREAGAPLTLVFEDEAVVVVDKPAGLVVEPDADRPSVVGLVGARCRGLSVEGRALPGVVHRLDRETSGLMVLAKTDAVRAALRQAFEEKRVEKQYLAVVLGEPPEALKLDTPYGRSPDNPRLFTTKVASPRRARLSFFVKERLQGAALLSVKLDTGRTHQIRVQLSEAGFPVLADAVYGGREARAHPVAAALGRHALHAARLSFAHPTDGRVLSFEAPMPEALAAAMDGLRRSVHVLPEDANGLPPLRTDDANRRVGSIGVK